MKYRHPTVFRTQFDPKGRDAFERLAGFETHIYGDAVGYFGEPRLSPLGSENENYNHYERTKIGKIHCSRLTTTGYATRSSEGIRGFREQHLFFCFCLKGQAELETAKQSVKLKEGDLHVNMARNYRLSFGPGVFERIVIPMSLVNPNVQKFDEFLIMREGNAVANVIRQIAREVNSKSVLNHVDQIAALSEIAVSSARLIVQNLIDENQFGGYDAILERAIEYISDNIERKDLSVSEIVNHSRTSRATLYRAFESLGGVGHYITSQRIELAKQKLRSGASQRGAVMSACYASGFTGPSQFTKAFKRHVGMKPTEYIRHCT